MTNQNNYNSASSGSSNNLIFQLLQERNLRETNPFVLVHESNSTLLKQVDALQYKLDLSEKEVSSLQHQLVVIQANSGSAAGGSAGSGASSSSSSAAAQAALKNEARLRDKLERLQEEWNAHLKQESEEKAQALRTAQELAMAKDQIVAHEKTIENLNKELLQTQTMVDHLRNNVVVELQSRTELAEKQYDGLKSTIRSLQEENDKLQKENRLLEERYLSDKTKTVDEMNVMTEMIEQLKKEVDMLRTLNKHEVTRNKVAPAAASGGWFGLGGLVGSSSSNVTSNDSDPQPASSSEKTEHSRKFGNFGVCVPTTVKQKITLAHSMEGTCVRYDHDSDANLFATAGSDSNVKVWDSGTGTVTAHFKGSPGHAMIGCDISGPLVVGAGSDKTCRVWNLRTQRMIHHLVGHAHKITCVRLLDGGKSVVTCSADRSIKLWDISRQTYRQTTTLRHSSTSNCIDVARGVPHVAVSGHLDGGLRFWDLRSGERTIDVSGIHEGGITSVCFHPLDHTKVLTNSMDSTLKIIDTRSSCVALQTMRHIGFSTSQPWSQSAYSPDGNFCIAASNMNGDVFVWSTTSGHLKTKLSSSSSSTSTTSSEGGVTGASSNAAGGHENTGVCGIDWGRGGSSGQQVASIDRKGTLILWA